MFYEIWRADRTQAVYLGKDDGRYYVLDVGGDRANMDRYGIFRTESKELARSVLEMTGGEYGGFEIKDAKDV